jgi:hypothetical protein
MERLQTETLSTDVTTPDTPPLPTPAAETLPLTVTPEVDTTAPELATAVSENVNRMRRNFSVGILTLSIVCGVWAVFGPLLIDRQRWITLFSGPQVVAAILAAGLSLVLALVVSAYWRGTRMRPAVRALAGSRDISTVGGLVDALLLEDGQNNRVASEALIELLPRLQASDAHFLNTQQRNKLCSVLSKSVDNVLYKDVTVILGPASLSKVAKKRAVDLRVAILQAFQQVGDSQALPVVERLASGPAKTPDQTAVRNAALECLPYLRERVSAEQAGRSLLRVAPQPGDAQLVRPAIGPVTHASQQLLRADNPTSGDVP